MHREPKPMKEMHEIQESLYEEHKHMKSEEKLKSLHNEAEEAERKYGLNLKKSRIHA